MPITATATTLDGVLILEPRVFEDERGFLFESYNQRDFEAATGLTVSFVQDNHSRSARGVLRGLHYQVRRPQGRLVRVTVGSIFDVAVDLRRSSPAFGRWVGMELSAQNKRQSWIPPGFAHGFLVTSEVAEVQYKASQYWDPVGDRSLLWNDPALAIDWPIARPPILSARDRQASTLASAEVFD